MSTLFSRHSSFRIFAISGVISVITLGAVLLFLGWKAALVASLLIAIELTFSFDNAIVNARVLATMNPFWQRMFMTVGIIIAVFGMRIIFPVLIVMFTAGLPWHQVVHLALNEPDKYAAALQAAHPGIASFGGMFLLMLALQFFFDDTREIRWLNRIEKGMQYIGQKWLHAAVSGVLLLVIAVLPVNHHPKETIIAGLVGIASYLAIHGLSETFSASREASKAVRKTALAGFASFLYLEILDASFSFDGVIGAFAVTQDVILIAIGLGIGALWVRSLTLFIVHRKVLHTYRYLEHSAHYVIGILAATLLVGLFYDIPEMIAGIIGLGVITAAVVSSIRDNKKDEIVRV